VLVNKRLISLCMVLLAAIPLCQANPFYWYDSGADFSSRSVKLLQSVAQDKLTKAGFRIEAASAGSWEKVGANADAVVVVLTVPLSPSKTYVHVIAMSDMDASAKKWAAQIMEGIKNDPRRTTKID